MHKSRISMQTGTEMSSIRYYIDRIVIIPTPLLFFEFLVAQMVKNLPAMQSSIPGLGRSLGEGNDYPFP